MLLTIGMPSYDNFDEVWFTVQILRIYHDLTNCEILVLDNYGEYDWLERWISLLGPESHVRYVKYTEKRGTGPAKEAVFQNAKGDFVLCMDSHVILASGVVDKLKQFIRENPNDPNLYQGPMQYDSLDVYTNCFRDKWETSMWGVWGPNMKKNLSEKEIANKIYLPLPEEPHEIWAMGMGAFGCFREKWLGFNPEFIGFGGEEVYIHEKYRKHGFKVISLPWLIWNHKFKVQGESSPYPNIIQERIKNYLLGCDELNLNKQPVLDHFGLGGKIALGGRK